MRSPAVACAPACRGAGVMAQSAAPPERGLPGRQVAGLAARAAPTKDAFRPDDARHLSFEPLHSCRVIRQRFGNRSVKRIVAWRTPPRSNPQRSGPPLSALNDSRVPAVMQIRSSRASRVRPRMERVSRSRHRRQRRRASCAPPESNPQRSGSPRSASNDSRVLGLMQIGPAGPQGCGQEWSG